MSRTFGHTKRQHYGWSTYRSAKTWRTEYNQKLRHKQKIEVNTRGVDEDFTLSRVREVSDMWEHPGD